VGDLPRSFKNKNKIRSTSFEEKIYFISFFLILFLKVGGGIGREKKIYRQSGGG
jgi:hypothetical protein